MAAFYILSVVIFLTFLAGGTTNPFLPLYAQSLGASLVNIAWIIGGFSTVTLVANLVWGRVSDRVGRRKPFLVCAMATFVLTSFLISNATVWWQLLPLRVLEGIASGAYGVASLALMGDLLDGHPHRARMIGAYRMSGSLAFSIAIVIAGTVAQRSGFHTTYTVAAIIYTVAFLVSLTMPEKIKAKRVETVRVTSFKNLLAGPMLPLLIVAASFGIPFAAVYSVWPLWVAEGLGLGREAFSRLWGLAAFVEVPCMAIAGYLTDRFGRRLTFLAGLTLFAGVYLLYFIVPTVPGLIAAQIIRGFAFAAFTATALTMAIEIAPADARGRAAGLFQFAQSLSQVIGSYAGGPLAQSFGYRPLFAGAAAALLMGAVYVQSALRRRSEPRKAVLN